MKKTWNLKKLIIIISTFCLSNKVPVISGGGGGVDEKNTIKDVGDFQLIKERGIAYPESERKCLPSTREKFHFSLIS